MPACLQAVPAGPAGIYYMFQASLPRWFADDNMLWGPYWQREFRGPSTIGDFDYTVGIGQWPSKSGFISDPAAPCSLMLDRDLNGGSPFSFSPMTRGLGGNCSTKHIMGQCLDAGSSPVGGAVVQGFRTVDDLYIGEAYTDGNGRYELPCPNTPTDAHYLVGYKAGGTVLAGTTVNTLVPTWRDGSV